ncbi:MAG TPA: GNAT family N-acetyltransferase [Micromonosporaceae bacterium]|nr:GNAT family N-acetyltransferase [Micromonosporaceae bacterium]
MHVIEVRPVPYDAPESEALIAAALADLAERYDGDGDATPVAATEFSPPDGAFCVARVGDQVAGCGGWRSHPVQERTAEIKRMYTVPGWRGNGVASAVLRALEASARAAGMRRVILETGVRQPEAIALYKRSGYVEIEKYGYYRDSPESVCYGRHL